MQIYVIPFLEYNFKLLFCKTSANVELTIANLFFVSSSLVCIYYSLNGMVKLSEVLQNMRYKTIS